MSSGRDFSLLAGRLVLGSYLAAHGAQKLFGAFDGPGLGPVAAGFHRIGLRPGRAMAAVAGTTELAGGLLTITGLADPLGPVAIAGTMAVASTTHRANGPFAAKGGYELALTNLGAALTLAATGPGRLSLDGATGRRLPRVLARLIMVGAMAASAANIARLLTTRPDTPTQVEADEPSEPEASDVGFEESASR